MSSIEVAEPGAQHWSWWDSSQKQFERLQEPDLQCSSISGVFLSQTPPKKREARNSKKKKNWLAMSSKTSICGSSSILTSSSSQCFQTCQRSGTLTRSPDYPCRDFEGWKESLNPNELSLLSILRFRRMKKDFSFDKSIEHTAISTFLSNTLQTTEDETWKKAAHTLLGKLKVGVYLYYDTI